jgi:CubicO group peptidase (beta-lactamase class C family)
MSQNLTRISRAWITACLLVACHTSLSARTWTEAATGRKIEADLVSTDSTSVIVATRDGKRFTLPLARLSAEDQAFVRGNGKPSAPPAKAATPVEDRFEDVPKLDLSTIPVSGDAHKALAAVDEAIKNVMVEKGIAALTFAVSKGGKILHDRAFGWADADLKEPLKPDVKMRVASMTKPVVSAAIQTLMTDGKLKADQLVFDVLDLGQFDEAKSCDPRFKQVTIQHLLDHKGGWDRDKSGDLTTRATKIADMFRVKLNEMEPMHIVRYGLTLPMDFDPGERYVYCNYGYIMLVRVIEKASGKKFMDYLHDTVCRESGAESFSRSATDARDRQPGEIWYCYHPEHPQKEVPLTFRTEARDGAGVLATTAADYCRFLEAYWISGKPRTSGRASYAFSGSHPGVTAICSQRTDGINYAAIANRRGGGRSDWNGDLRAAIDAALDAVAEKL